MLTVACCDSMLRVVNNYVECHYAEFQQYAIIQPQQKLSKLYKDICVVCERERERESVWGMCVVREIDR